MCDTYSRTSDQKAMITSDKDQAPLLCISCAHAIPAITNHTHGSATPFPQSLYSEESRCGWAFFSEGAP